VLLVLLASQSLWLRDLSWRAVGMHRPTSIGRTILFALGGATTILVVNRLVLGPLIARITGSPPDLSALVSPGDGTALVQWMLQAWTLAAFAEEMVFRGYLLSRLTDLLGTTRGGRVIAIVTGGTAFGIAHAYQGSAGVIATGAIGCFMGALYFRSERNLWSVILCHAFVDTVGLLALYYDMRWILFP
jgi:hypothetical protein